MVIGVLVSLGQTNLLRLINILVKCKEMNVNPETLLKLDLNQQLAMMLAAHIRNELEDFHVKHIPDECMPELNATIRYAIYDFYENVMTNQSLATWLSMMIPDYWEIPGIDPKPEFTGEYLWDGKPVPRSGQSE